MYWRHCCVFLDNFTWTNPSVESEIKCLRLTVLPKGIKVANKRAVFRERVVQSLKFYLHTLFGWEEVNVKMGRFVQEEFCFAISSLIENSTIKGIFFASRDEDSQHFNV